MESSESVRLLRKAMRRRVPESGTVVRFQCGDRFTYVAVFVAHKWYLSGNGRFFGGNTFTNENFVASVLGHYGVTDIEVATDWELV